MESTIALFVTAIFKHPGVKRALADSFGSARAVRDVVLSGLLDQPPRKEKPRQQDEDEAAAASASGHKDIAASCQADDKKPDVKRRGKKPVEGSMQPGKDDADADADADATKQSEKKSESTRPKKPKKPAAAVSELDKMTIVLLKEKCKSLGIKPVGNKQALINKIKEHIKTDNVGELADDDGDEIEIIKDDQGLYVHAQSGLIFNPNARVVVACKDQDDNVLPLTAEHIELCNQYGFEYRLDED